MKPSALYRLATLCLLTTGAIVYLPGLSGGFVFDDFPNLVYNERLTAVSGWNWPEIWRAAWSSESGPLKRPLSMLSFAFDHASAGLDPAAFKRTSLAIHLLCGLIIFMLARILMRRLMAANLAQDTRQADLAALLAAGLWLLHPLQLTSVLYVVQRMASLAALFSALGMLAYAVGRERQIKGQKGLHLIGAAYLICLPLASLSKENGVLLPVFLLLLEMFFFRLRATYRHQRTLLITLHLFCAILPGTLGTAFLIVSPDWILRSYDNRDFGLYERLLTQARALWFYLSVIAVPDITRMGLYHDDFVVSRGLLTPPITGFAVGALAMAVALVPFCWRRWPVLGFSVLFFLAAHALESSFFGLEMVHEHRNYLASFGPLLAFGYLVGSCMRRWPDSRRAMLLGAAALLCVTASATALRAWHWGDDLQRARLDARNHPDSPRSRIDAGIQLIALANQVAAPETLLEEARSNLVHAAERDNYGATAHLGLIVVDNRLGRPVDNAWLQRTLDRLRTPPIASATPGAFIQLLQCHRAGPCSFEPRTIKALEDALAANPALRPFDQAMIDTEFAQLYMDAGDALSALGYTRQAVARAPDAPQLWLNLAATLLANGQPGEAAHAVDEAAHRDVDRFHVQRISTMRAQIANWRGNNSRQD